ncbi:protein S100-A10-like [Nelusetta ayraudi]|uniref:protein S100-A10-like n=1 Tax=Nelusetta ayraudi TaxID=303726 RepID=UPI003F7031A6
MTEMEKSLESMMVVFQQYGAEHGDKKFLNKSQLKKLLEEQFPSFVKAQKNPKLAEEILKDLDHDRDDLLNFEEFLPFIVGLALACEKGQIMNQKKSKK